MALVLGVTLWLVLRDDPYVVPAPSDRPARIQSAPAAALLQELVHAVRTGDTAAAAGLAPRGDTDAQAQLRDLVANVQAIGVRGFSMRYLDEAGGLDAEGEWPATATLTWRFAGFDAGVATSEVPVRFAVVDDRVGIATLGDATPREGSATPVWFTDPVQVRRTAQTLVVATRRAARYSALARRAVPIVQRVLPGWPGRLVVEVPSSASALDVALGVERGRFTNVAGVTATVDGSGSSSAPVHVFLNPARITELEQTGAQVVVSHEAAHVALGATATQLPVWLSEGFADFIALRDVPLPLSTTAAQIARQVRREGPPRALPGDRDFDEESDYFGATYEAAWFACRLLGERAGEDTLLRFYRDADGVDDFAGLFRRTFGLSLAQFTKQWRSALSDLAA